MEVRYNVSGERRKELITAMADLLEAKPRYNGAPSFSYTVGDYLVDKQGTVSFSRFHGQRGGRDVAGRSRGAGFRVRGCLS